MITEDYVSFETAKLLKEKGFDAECKKYYNLKMLTNLYYGSEYVRNRDLKDEDDCIAPTLQMAMKWLREVKNIQIEVSVIGEENKDNEVEKWVYGWRVQNSTLIDRHQAVFNTYEEACEAAIKYCLENLI